MTDRNTALPPRDRGQSISINYTLSLVIVSLMMSGLFISMSGYLDSEREQVTRSEFEVLGNRLAADISTADRVARTTTGGGEVRIRTSIPESVAGSSYSIVVSSSSTGSGFYDVEIQFRAPQYGVSQNVTTRTKFEVVDGGVRNGPYEVVFTGSTLEVRDD
jgi:type II secretory pathway pseudopilin PulG